MGAAIAKIIFKNGNDQLTSNYNSLNKIPAKTILNEQIDELEQLYIGKKLIIIVNVSLK